MRANAPVNSSFLLERPRLLRRLTGPDGDPAGFVLLNAPSGYGKSTLANQVVASLSPCQYQTSWLRVTTPSKPSFWRNLCAQLPTQTAAPENTDDETEAHEWVQKRVARISAPILLVIDSYHHVSAAQTDAA